jgi:crotonobetainyl-CoA:carnitine CoA-transferase CaiB-like acyl-CoA transferase
MTNSDRAANAFPTQDLPLAGMRVLELGGYIAGPYACSLLCALGADVVKVERPGGGDDFRRGVDDQSLYFIQYNAGKRSLAVDLKHPEGVALVRALVPRFDVVMENMRPGKLAAMGLGPADCLELRPDLIYASATGFGSGGPLAQRAAYDTIGQAVGGLYSLLSDAGAAQLAGTPMADLITGFSTVAGVLAALAGRGVSGQGRLVETSLMEAVSTLTIDAFTQHFEDGGRDPSRQSRHPQAQNFCVKTATGEDIAIHLSSSQKFWLAFVEAIGRPELAEDPRFTNYNLRVEHYFELVEIVEPEFLKKSAAEWERLLADNDVPFGPVLTMSAFRAHPQTEWLDLLEPERNGVSLVRPPWRFDGSRPQRSGVAPKVGEHTRELAREVYDETRINQLVDDGVLYVTPNHSILTGERDPRDAVVP